MAGILDYLQKLLGSDPEAQGAAAASSAMAPAVTQYAGDVASGKYAQQGLGQLTGAYHWDPAKSAQENAVAMAKSPLALDQAMNVAMGVGPGAIRAYHGSPHSFDRFDFSKVGTGEGNQAYGYGLYFAENPAVAKGYKDTLSSTGNAIYSGEITPTVRHGLDILNQAGAARRWENDPATQLEYMLENYRHSFNSSLPDSSIVGGRAGLSKDIAALESIDPSKLSRGGRMYEVNIHADPNTLLDLDKPLRQQSTPVLDALMGLDPFGSRFGRSVTDLRQSLTPRNPAQAAEFSKAGIPGLQYYDQGSRALGEGSRNYVTFDDDIIEILKKYGLAGFLGGTGAAAVGGER